MMKKLGCHLQDKNKMSKEMNFQEFPLLPLRDVVVYPYMAIPLFVGRDKSMAAIEKAMSQDQKIVLVAQKTTTEDNPNKDDLYTMGTLSTILQLMKLPDGTLKVLVEGVSRFNIKESSLDGESFSVEGTVLEEKGLAEEAYDALRRTLLMEFDQYVKLNKKIPPEATASLSSALELSRLVDTIIGYMSLKIETRQEVLEIIDSKERADRLSVIIQDEIEILAIEKSIRTRVKSQMDKNQKEYFLNEQMKAIQSELGVDEDDVDGIQEIELKIDKAKMSQEAEKKALGELKKLKQMAASSAEAGVVRNYLETLTGMPWGKRKRICKDLDRAEAVLNEDHYGLELIKERVLEYLAVQQRMKKLKGPILCFVGPPGVGKTSLGESIARATGRNYIRMALGGVRDEAEIRGHRRTYIGSMPGQISQKVSKSGVNNPLFLLDEIDKMSSDFRGDPASAMLEVLDPEQNKTFNDHYLEVDYDLSNVMFIATANSLDIPEPLLDRMEVIDLSGYTENEKMHIAQEYLVPKQIANNGLKDTEIKITEEAIIKLIRNYTREAGVRSLDREIAKICRKSVKKILSDDNLDSVMVDEIELCEYLGTEKFRYGIADKVDSVGQVTGLAWTRVGGELLTIEAVVIPGKGKVIRTGKLGDVMQESIQAAMTVVQKECAILGLKDKFFEENDFHIHVPEGATPKDGPSAGIAMCTALMSAITCKKVKCNVAMTGEITLRGEVLPIGGLKEKLLAALRGGIKRVLIPLENKKDLSDIPKEVTSGLDIVCVQWVAEVFAQALEVSDK
jgi:ATP-dependent Lon protease